MDPRVVAKAIRDALEDQLWVSMVVLRRAAESREDRAVLDIAVNEGTGFHRIVISQGNPGAF